MGQLILSMMSQIVAGTKDVDLVLDPQASEALVLEAAGRVVQVGVADPIVKAVPAASGATLALGATVLLWGLEMEALAEQQATQSLAATISNAVPPMVQAARRYAAGDCELCVRRSVWGQSTPRSYVETRYQKRL